MEEAEALCTKMGIMVRGGVFRCFGSSTHIKNKYATGYEIEVKIKRTNVSILTQAAIEFGLSENLEDKVVLSETIEKLRQTDYPEVVLAMISKEGLGKELAMEAELSPEGEVRV